MRMMIADNCHGEKVSPSTIKASKTVKVGMEAPDKGMTRDASPTLNARKNQWSPKNIHIPETSAIPNSGAESGLNPKGASTMERSPNAPTRNVYTRASFTKFDIMTLSSTFTSARSA